MWPLHGLSRGAAFSAGVLYRKDLGMNKQGIIIWFYYLKTFYETKNYLNDNSKKYNSQLFNNPIKISSEKTTNISKLFMV